MTSFKPHGPKAACVIIGHYDLPLERQAARARRVAQKSASYREILTNSVRIDGERKTYMDLFNRGLQLAHGSTVPLSPFAAPSLAVYSLASYLEAHGHPTVPVNYLNFDTEILEAALAENPLAVAITTTYYTDEQTPSEIAKHVRMSSPEAWIVIGGPYTLSVVETSTTRTQDALLASMDVDIAIVDPQGEATLELALSVLESGDYSQLSRVPNLIYRLPGTKTYQRTPRQPERHDFTVVDWSRFPRNRFVPTTYMRTSRGCPCRCAFCDYPRMAGAYDLRDVSDVIAELRVLHEAGVRNVIWVDDTLNLPLPRFKNMLREMAKERFDFRWMSFFRCASADEETFDLMAETGCIASYLGIESGDDALLKLMNKGAHTAAYRRGISALRARGILTFGSFIVGYPGETEDSVKRTLEFIETTGLDYFNAGIYFHNVLAPVEERRSEFAILGGQYSWNHSTMNWQTAANWAEHLIRNVQGALPLPLYGYSIWSLPYLLGKGFTVQQYRGFAEIARRMMIKSMDDYDVDYPNEDAELISLFHDAVLPSAV